MKTVYIEKNDPFTTLTTWLYCSLHMAYAAEKMGFIPYINWHNGVQYYNDPTMFAKQPNQFEWYFKQPFIEKPHRDETWTWESQGWGANVETSKFQLMNEPLKTIKDFYKKNLIFNESTNAIGESLVKKYNIDFSKTIGITWRGTDNVTDGRPRMPIETYYPFIDEILTKNPDFRIMCTAEEQSILEPLFKRYPQAFNIDEFVSSPLKSKHNPERLGSRSGYEKGLQPALMVWMFSKCAHYIKNRSSTGAVASWLSNGRIVCLGHEETLSYNLAYDYVEIEGKKYPL